MEHIVLLWYSLMFCIALIAVYIAFQMYRQYRKNFLRNYSIYLLGSLLTVFSYIILYYIGYNILGLNTYTDKDILFLVEKILAYIVLSLNIVLLTSCYFSLLKKPDKNGRLKHTIFFVGIFGLVHLFGILLYLRGEAFKNTLAYTSVSFNYISVLLLIFICGRIIFEGLRKKRKTERRAVVIFGGVYFAIYVLYPLISIIPRSLGVYYSFFVILIQCVFPILWLKRYFLRFYLLDEIKNYQYLLEVISEKYNISVREKEIIALIAKGMSNDEIMDELYISSSTVRNHIYNIYKKIGINSRGQLLHMLIETEDVS